MSFSPNLSKSLRAFHWMSPYRIAVQECRQRIQWRRVVKCEKSHVKTSRRKTDTRLSRGALRTKNARGKPVPCKYCAWQYGATAAASPCSQREKEQPSPAFTRKLGRRFADLHRP